MTGDVGLQASREDLIDDAVTVIGVVGLLPVVICVNINTASLKAMLWNFMETSVSSASISLAHPFLILSVHLCARADLTFAMSVKNIQRRNEELVCVLLLVPSQVTGMRPHEVQEAERDVRRAMA